MEEFVFDFRTTSMLVACTRVRRPLPDQFHIRPQGLVATIAIAYPRDAVVMILLLAAYIVPTSLPVDFDIFLRVLVVMTIFGQVVHTHDLLFLLF